MKKDFGPQSWLFPLPVLLIGTFDKEGTPNLMNAAWGGIYDTNKVYICMSEHKTTDNLKETGCFTVSFGTEDTVQIADYVGMASGKKVNKVGIAGLTVTKSDLVNAPVYEEFKLVLECKVDKLIEEDGGYYIIGDILNVKADESVLDEEGKVDYLKLKPITYNPVRHVYTSLGPVVGKAFDAKNPLLKKK